MFCQFLIHFIRSKFTIKEEQTNTLPFSDILLIEMMKTLTPLFIEKIHIKIHVVIYIGTCLHQSLGREGRVL